MQYKVNDTCIGCWACAFICAEWFVLNAEMKAEGIILNPEAILKYKSDLELAQWACPVWAIYVEE